MQSAVLGGSESVHIVDANVASSLIVEWAKKAVKGFASACSSLPAPLAPFETCRIR